MCDLVSKPFVYSEALMLKIVEETEALGVLKLPERLSLPLDSDMDEACLGDVHYSIRLIRYTAHLKHLLDNPPALKTLNSVKAEQCDEVVDNYLRVVGELIRGLYSVNQAGVDSKDA